MEGASPPPVLSLEAGSPLTKPPSTVVQLQELACSPQSVRKLDGDEEAIPEAGTSGTGQGQQVWEGGGGAGLVTPGLVFWSLFPSWP